jgi:hypothetical protein
MLCDFAQIMVFLLPFNTIFTSGKRNVSHSIKSREFGRCRMIVILLLDRNSHTDKAKWAGAKVEKPLDGNLTHVQIVFQNALKWPKLNFRHVIKFMDSDSSDFEDKFPHSIHTSINFSCWSMSWVFGTFKHEATLPFKLRKLLKNLFYSLEVALKLVYLWVSSIFRCKSSFNHCSILIYHCSLRHVQALITHCMFTPSVFIKAEVLSMNWHLIRLQSKAVKLDWANNNHGS